MEATRGTLLNIDNESVVFMSPLMYFTWYLLRDVYLSYIVAKNYILTELNLKRAIFTHIKARWQIWNPIVRHRSLRRFKRKSSNFKIKSFIGFYFDGSASNIKNKV
jgi:hypothetical protein